MTLTDLILVSFLAMQLVTNALILNSLDKILDILRRNNHDSIERKRQLINNEILTGNQYRTRFNL